MPNHNNIPIWEVDISVIAPISVHSEVRFDTRKELEHPEAFYSKIRIIDAENGFKVTLTAFAPNSELAEKAGLLFLGRMLDVLSLKFNIPIQLNLSRNVLIPRGDQAVRRILDRSDFRWAFKESRLLSLTESTFLRSLSWYRKGKYTQDPFDKFLAFWNAIETVASKYNPNKVNCRERGSICHIWESFRTIWGDCDNWLIIGGQEYWIDQCNEHRRNIAHGIVPIDIEMIELVLEKMEELEAVCYKFLIDWREEQLNPEITEDIEKRLI